jgi:hypothetical protein
LYTEFGVQNIKHEDKRGGRQDDNPARHDG